MKILNFKGQGGKESIYEEFANQILSLPLKRQSDQMYDFINQSTNQKIEFKKQVNQQWFDASKYYQLTEEEENILMHFLLIDKNGIPKSVYEIKLITFVDLNFTPEYIKLCYELKQKFPKHQSKMDLKILDEVKKPEFELIWSNTQNP